MQAKETDMQKIHHLFVIDPISSLNIKLDSSLRIACALTKLGHEVAVCTPQDISWLSQDGSASCLAQSAVFKNSDIQDLSLSEPKLTALDTFHAIHMRKDPPYDLAYITCTWLLESAARKGVKVWNAPQALRDFNEKLGIFHFPEYIHPALVSTQPHQLKDFFLHKAHGDAILKPLTLFGGRGVLRLNNQDMTPSQIDQILAEETQHGQEHRLIQPFDKSIFDGEVRVFTAGGEAIAWCLKKPQGQNFLANTRSGATLEAYTPSSDEQNMVQDIANRLLKKGVFFIGFDIIGGKVSEINITSPRLLHSPEDTHDYYSKIAAIIAKNLESNQ